MESGSPPYSLTSFPTSPPLFTTLYSITVLYLCQAPYHLRALTLTVSPPKVFFHQILACLSFSLRFQLKCYFFRVLLLPPQSMKEPSPATTPWCYNALRDIIWLIASYNSPQLVNILPRKKIYLKHSFWPFSLVLVYPMDSQNIC